jgi:hypothetical protein
MHPRNKFGGEVGTFSDPKINRFALLCRKRVVGLLPSRTEKAVGSWITEIECTQRTELFHFVAVNFTGRNTYIISSNPS